MVRNQRQVMAEMDRMNGRHLRKVREGYKRETLGPLLDVIRSAKSTKGLSRALSPALFRRMKTDALETAVTDAGTQASLVGAITAGPRSEGT